MLFFTQKFQQVLDPALKLPQNCYIDITYTLPETQSS